jgi:hypothetical protein
MRIEDLAVHNALEFKVIYGLDVVPIPPNRRRIRVDHDDHVYRTRAVQAMAAVENVATMLQAGRPVLVGTTNIQDAEAIGELCTRRGISSRVLSAKNHFEEAAIIEEAGKAGRVTIAAQMAGRGVDIRLDEAARAAGGLQVLGIGRSEARRLDEQLIGRAGRQGDPGSSLFILSLEDDLFATMSVGTVKALISKFQLDETDPIKHRLVTRAIRRAQRNLVLVRFSQRQIALLFDQYVNASREAVFRRRATLFASASYEQEIERLIGRYVDRLGQVPPDDLHEELARLEDVLAIHVPEGVYVAGQRGAWRDELTEVIKRTYADRRAQAEPYAPARERVVLLRSIDYCWSLFLERTSLDFDSLLAVFSGRFGSERDQELRRRFLGATSKLNAEIDDTTLRFLMRLHDPIGLRDIKFWRGLGLAYRGNGDVDLADGLAPSPDTWILPASPTQEPEKPRGGLPPPKGPPRRQSHSELLTAYLAHLKERGLGQRRLHEVGEVVEAFLRSDQDGTRVFTAPLDALGAYLAGLAHQRRGPLARYRIRRIVMQFLEYLSSEGMLGPRARLSPRRMVLRRVRDAFAMVRPTTMLKLGWIAAVFVAYRLLSTLPISSVLTAVRDGQVIRFPSPTLAYQLVDQLLLAGAFHALALGMVGVAPLVCVDLLLARFGPQGRSPLLYLPPALILSAVAGQRVVATTWTGEQPGWSAVALLATSLFLVSCILMLLIWSVRYVGFITGVELVLLGNALVLGWQLWDEQSHQADGRAVAGLVLLGLVLSMLRVRAARVPVELVRTAKFDLETGNVSNVTTRAQISLSPGSYHYLAALLIVLVVGAWIGRIGVPTSGALAPLGDLSPRLLAVLGFACLALWLSFKRSDYQLSRRNVAAFLRGRDLFVAGAATWDRAVSDIRRRVRRRQMLDATIQAMLVGLLWLAVASGSAGLSWQETLYRLAILLSALQLFALVGRRAAGSLHGASASTTGVLSIPPADEDEGPWMRRSWRRLRTRYGRLELVGFALALWGVLWPDRRTPGTVAGPGPRLVAARGPGYGRRGCSEGIRIHSARGHPGPVRLGRRSPVRVRGRPAQVRRPVLLGGLRRRRGVAWRGRRACWHGHRLYLRSGRVLAPHRGGCGGAGPCGNPLCALCCGRGAASSRVRRRSAATAGPWRAQQATGQASAAPQGAGLGARTGCGHAAGPRAGGGRAPSASAAGPGPPGAVDGHWTGGHPHRRAEKSEVAGALQALGLPAPPAGFHSARHLPRLDACWRLAEVLGLLDISSKDAIPGPGLAALTDDGQTLELWTSLWEWAAVEGRVLVYEGRAVGYRWVTPPLLWALWQAKAPLSAAELALVRPGHDQVGLVAGVLDQLVAVGGVERLGDGGRAGRRDRTSRRSSWLAGRPGPGRAHRTRHRSRRREPRLPRAPGPAKPAASIPAVSVHHHSSLDPCVLAGTRPPHPVGEADPLGHGRNTDRAPLNPAVTTLNSHARRGKRPLRERTDRRHQPQMVLLDHNR